MIGWPKFRSLQTWYLSPAEMNTSHVAVYFQILAVDRDRSFGDVLLVNFMPIWVVPFHAYEGEIFE
jgi:hypothetical protein